MEQVDNIELIIGWLLGVFMTGFIMAGHVRELREDIKRLKEERRYLNRDLTVAMRDHRQ